MITFHHIVDACVAFCFLKKEFLNLTINMQLLYFITTVTSQAYSARHHQRAVQCSTELLVELVNGLSY